MSYVKRVFNTPPLIARALAEQYALLARNLKGSGLAQHNAVVDAVFVAQPDTNDTQIQVAELPGASFFAATHAEAIIKANAMRPYILAHLKDGTYAHNAADDANAALITAPDATDVPTLTALLAQYRTALNQHYVNGGVHNRILIAQGIVTVPIDEPTNIAVTNTMLLTYFAHTSSAAVSIEVTGT